MTDQSSTLPIDEEESTVCLNCGTGLMGKFCHECGQSREVRRYKPSNFAKEAYQSMRSIDLTASIRTGFRLIRDPGTFVREYFAGKRVGFINPVKLFFYSFVIEIAIDSAIRYFAHDSAATSSVASDKDLQIIDLVATIVFGFLWALFFRRSGFNVAEFAAAAIFFQAALNFAQAALMILESPLRIFFPEISNLRAAITLVPVVVYSYYFAYRLFAEPIWKTLIKQTVLTLLYLVVVVLFLMFVFVIRNAIANSPH